jgi:hypothetical protein
MYLFIYLKWEKCPHFGILRKFSPNGIMQRRKLRRFSLNCFICANRYKIYPICTQWVYMGKRCICHNIAANVLPKERSKHRPSGIGSL